MPRIPMIEAQRAPGLLALPRPTPETFGASGFKALAGMGEHLQKAADTLQAEQDKLDLAEDVGWFEGQVKATKLALSFDPDYRTHAERFTTAVKGFERELATRPRSASVRTTLQGHIARVVPEETVNVQTGALALWTSHQRAQLDREEERLSQAAAEAPSPDARDQVVALYDGLLAGQASARILTPVEAEQKRQTFRQKAGEKSMELLARTNPTELFQREGAGAFANVDPIKREKILDLATRRLEKAERDRERERKAASDAMRKEFYAEILSGGDVRVAIEARRRDFESADQYREMVELQTRVLAEGGVDDPMTKLQMEREIRLRVVTSEREIVRTIGHGISAKTGNALLALFESMQDENHPSKDPEFAEGMRQIELAFTKSGPGAQLFAQDEIAMKSFARDLYWRRVVDQQQPPSIWRQIVTEYANLPSVVRPPQPPPRFPTVRESIKARDDKMMTQEELDVDLDRHAERLQREAEAVRQQAAEAAKKKPGLVDRAKEFFGGERK